MNRATNEMRRTAWSLLMIPALLMWRPLVPAAQAQQVRFVDVDGAFQTFVADSTIVGSFAALGRSAEGGVVRSADGTITVKDYPGAYGTQVTGINHAGDVCGFYYDYNPQDPTSEFRTRKPNGAFSAISQPLPGEPIGLNSSGVLIGGFQDDIDPVSGNVRVRSYVAVPTELVDPVPDLLDGPAVTAVPSSLHTQGRPVQGVAADGVARVVVRIPAATAGQQFTVRLLNDREPHVQSTSEQEDGALATKDAQTSWSTQIVVHAEPVGQESMAFAIYRAPKDFPREGTPVNAQAFGPDDLKASRQVFLEITPQGGTPFTQVIEIVRPPVLLVHGLWSDETSWDRFSPLTLDPRFSVHRANYSFPVAVSTSSPSYSSDRLSRVRANSLGLSFNATPVSDSTCVRFWDQSGDRIDVNGLASGVRRRSERCDCLAVEPDKRERSRRACSVLGACPFSRNHGPRLRPAQRPESQRSAVAGHKSTQLAVVRPCVPLNSATTAIGAGSMSTTLSGSGRSSSAIAATLLACVPSLTLAQTLPTLAFSSPPDGTVVAPGASVTVTLASPVGVNFTRVVIGGDDLHVGTGVPFSAIVVVPNDAPAGLFEVDAMGVTSSGGVVEARSLALQLERQDTPTGLTAAPSTLRFRSPGYDLPVRARATYPDGTEVDVTESAHITYTSANPAVAVVDSRGMVSAVGVGTTNILVRLDATPAALARSVAVTVAEPTLTGTPSMIQFGTVPIGSSATLAVTLTNTRATPVSVTSVRETGMFTATSDCVSRSPLQPGGTCAALVTFTPTVSGPVRGVLKSTNDFDALETGVPLSGEGGGLRRAAIDLISSPNPSVLGQAVTVTATVSDTLAGGTPAPTGTATFADGATTLASATVSGGSTASAIVTSLGIGSHVLTASYSGDSAYGPSTSAPLTQVVRYAAAGATCAGGPGHQILQPVNSDGTSVFKQGRTVPAKFRVCDANGRSIGTAGVVQDFRLTQIISGTASDVNESVSSTTPDTAFRWDASGQQWVFNISTSGQDAQKTYVYTVTLNDGTTIGFRYGLR